MLNNLGVIIRGWGTCGMFQSFELTYSSQYVFSLLTHLWYCRIACDDDQLVGLCKLLWEELITGLSMQTHFIYFTKTQSILINQQLPHHWSQPAHLGRPSLILTHDQIENRLLIFLLPLSSFCHLPSQLK